MGWQIAELGSTLSKKTTIKNTKQSPTFLEHFYCLLSLCHAFFVTLFSLVFSSLCWCLLFSGQPTNNIKHWALDMKHLCGGCKPNKPNPPPQKSMGEFGEVGPKETEQQHRRGRVRCIKAKRETRDKEVWEIKRENKEETNEVEQRKERTRETKYKERKPRGNWKSLTNTIEKRPGRS